MVLFVKKQGTVKKMPKKKKKRERQKVLPPSGENKKTGANGGEERESLPNARGNLTSTGKRRGGVA